MQASNTLIFSLPSFIPAYYINVNMAAFQTPSHNDDIVGWEDAISKNGLPYMIIKVLITDETVTDPEVMNVLEDVNIAVLRWHRQRLLASGQ